MATSNLNIFLKKKRNFLLIGKKKINGKNHNATTVCIGVVLLNESYYRGLFTLYMECNRDVLQHLYDPNKRMLVNLISYVNGILSTV